MSLDLSPAGAAPAACLAQNVKLNTLVSTVHPVNGKAGTVLSVTKYTGDCFGCCTHSHTNPHAGDAGTCYLESGRKSARTVRAERCVN